MYLFTFTMVSNNTMVKDKKIMGGQTIPWLNVKR
jgi:hypothetical protein